MVSASVLLSDGGCWWQYFICHQWLGGLGETLDLINGINSCVMFGVPLDKPAGAAMGGW